MIDAQVALSLVTPLAVGGLFIYIRSIKTDVKDMSKRMTELSNGCFARHEKIARELGQNEMKISSAHCRIDSLPGVLR